MQVLLDKAVAVNFAGELAVGYAHPMYGDDIVDPFAHLAGALV